MCLVFCFHWNFLLTFYNVNFDFFTVFSTVDSLPLPTGWSPKFKPPPLTPHTTPLTNTNTQHKATMNNNNNNNHYNPNARIRHKKSDKTSSASSSSPSLTTIDSNGSKRKDRRDAAFRSELSLISQENSADMDTENEIENENKNKDTNKNMNNNNNNKSNTINSSNNNINASNDHNKKKNKNKNSDDLKISSSTPPTSTSTSTSTSSTTLKSVDAKQGSASASNGTVAVTAKLDSVWSSVALAFLFNFGYVISSCYHIMLLFYLVIQCYVILFYCPLS